MQQAKGKLVLEHLVVQEAGRSQQLRQQELDDLLRYGAEELFAEQSTEQAGKATSNWIFLCLATLLEFTTVYFSKLPPLTLLYL